jgi:hypothetical protein
VGDVIESHCLGRIRGQGKGCCSAAAGPVFRDGGGNMPAHHRKQVLPNDHKTRWFITGRGRR